MSNMAVASANKNYYTAVLHDVEGELSEVAERRNELQDLIDESDGDNPAAESEDRALEQIEEALKKQKELIESIKKAAEQLITKGAKDMAGNFSANG